MMKNIGLAFEAKSFYNAFLNLQKIDSNSPAPYFYLPAIVNGAFSIELAIKSILTENGIKYGKEHNLLELFLLLPDRYRYEFWMFFYQKAPQYQDANEWCNELILISDSFVDYRYCFEKQTPAFDLDFFTAFAYAAFCTLTSHFSVEIKQTNATQISTEEMDKMIEQNRKDSIERILEELSKRRNRRKK